MADREPPSMNSDGELSQDGDEELSQVTSPPEASRCGPARVVLIRNTFFETIDGPTRSDARFRSRSESDRSSDSSGTRLCAGRGLMLMRDDLNKIASSHSSSSSQLLRPFDSSAWTTGQPVVDEAPLEDAVAVGPALPSLGAAGHEAGECRPCIYHETAEGCRHGSACTFCHFPHERKRLSKSKRAHVKQLVNSFCDCFPADLEHTLELLLRDASTEGQYVRSIIRSRIRCPPQEMRTDGQKQEVAEALLQGLTHRDLGETASRALANVCRRYGKRRIKKWEASDLGHKVAL